MRQRQHKRRWEYIQNHPITNIEIRLFLKSSVGFDWFKQILDDVSISFSRNQKGHKLGDVLKKSREPNTKESHSKSEIPISSFWEMYEPDEGYWVKRIKPLPSSFKLVAGVDSEIPWKWMEIPNVVNLQDLASLTSINIGLPPSIFQAGVEDLIFRINGETYSFSVYFSDHGLDAHQHFANTFHSFQIQNKKDSIEDPVPLFFSMGFQGIELLNIFYQQMMPDYSRVSKKEGGIGGQSGPNGNAISFYPSMPIGFNKTEESKDYSFTIPGTKEFDFPKMIKETEKLIKEDEKNTEAYLQLASIFSMQGRFQDVISCLSSAINKATPTLGLYMLLGEAFHRLGRYDDALIQFRNATSLEKNDPDAQFGIAVVSEQLGNFETAINHFEKAISLKPDEARYQSALSQTLGRLGRLKEAVPVARGALEINPENTESIILLAILLHLEGNFDEALELTEKVIKTNPNSAKVNRHHAQILESKGELEQAVNYYRRSLELKKETDCFFELGRALCNLECWTESESVIDEGISFDPDHFGLIFVLAVTKANQEKFDDALELLNKALKINPNSSEAKELFEKINNHLSKS